MRIGWIVDWALAGLLLLAPAVRGQSARASSRESRSLIASARQGSGPEVTRGEVIRDGEMIREIDDPRNGDRWILTHDSSHPAGPGRLVLLASVHILARQAVAEEEASAAVIHAGDRVMVEEHSALVEARLEGVAMGSALVGSPLNVRLSMGGKVLRAEAIGPGRAVFHEETRR